MCGPAALALGAAVVTAAGTVYGGMAANAQGKYGQRVAEANVKAKGVEAQDAIERGKLESRKIDREYSQIGGQQRAAMAANGVALDYGSAEQVQQDTAMFRNEDRDAHAHNVIGEIRGLDMSIVNERAKGRAARAQGKAALTGSILSAGGSLLSGASQYGKMKQG